MGFSTYTEEFPRPARMGRKRSEATVEVEEALTESARSGKPVVFDWTPAPQDIDREKARIRSIAFKLGFNCSLYESKDGKIILKAEVKDGKSSNGEDHEAARMVSDAESMAERLEKLAEEQLKVAADLHSRTPVAPAAKSASAKVSNPIFQKPVDDDEPASPAPPRKTTRKAT